MNWSIVLYCHTIICRSVHAYFRLVYVLLFSCFGGWWLVHLCSRFHVVPVIVSVSGFVLHLIMQPEEVEEESWECTSRGEIPPPSFSLIAEGPRPRDQLFTIAAGVVGLPERATDLPSSIAQINRLNRTIFFSSDSVFVIHLNWLIE